MNDPTNLLQTLGGIAGIAGLGFGIFLLIFRDVIARNIFGKLTREHTYRTIKLILIFSFLIAALGLGSWTFLAFLEQTQDIKTIEQKLTETEGALEEQIKNYNEITNKIEKTTYPGVEELERNVTIDLQGWQEGEQSECVWSTHSRLVRAVSGSKTYWTSHATSGQEPRWWSNTHELDVIKNNEPDRTSGLVMSRYVIEFDIGDEKLFEPFDLQYSSERYGGFQGKTREWAAIATNYPTRQLVMEVRFPQEKPMKNYQLLAYPDADSFPRERFEGDRIVEQDPKGKWVRWKINNPQLRYIYRINWEW